MDSKNTSCQCLRVQGKGADGPQYAPGLIGALEA
jgi:hypothetical protein